MTDGGRRGPRVWRRVAAWVLSATMVVAGISATAASASATPSVAATGVVENSLVKTADLSKFQPGNIISDAVFFNSSTMGEAQIQSFLQSKVPTCQSGYTCLKDWYDTSRTTNADAMCGAYSGGMRERASTIIFKVAQACGINPQVLLVMLQKEQGLVTHTWPSDWRYTIAMGQGCPDTAACDTRYYGFFNQVYGAAWQMKRYANPAGTSKYFTWYAPGNTWNVRWHPNEGCGSSPVYIQNQATANLYYYTPYQPNAAAIRAGYGEGDGCSSYGNRNFYQYFTDWFGATSDLGSVSIAGRWQALGGSAGVLGGTVGAVVCGKSQNGCYQNFEHGAISWTSATGAWETLGAIRARWSALSFEDGVLGYPISAPTCGTRDGGCYQDFQRGAISWTAATGSWETFGAIRARWKALRFEDGVLGYPVGAPTCGLRDGGCYQDYQRGAITWTASVGAWETYGSIRARWQTTRFEAGVLGYPRGAVTCGMKDDGCYQNFQNGAITWAPATGAWETYGPARARWAAGDFERGQLGFPTGPPVLGEGVGYQTFQGGTVGWTSAYGAFASTGDIGARWTTIGLHLSPLGAPIGEVVCGTRDGGCYQNFQHGAISASRAGAWETFGEIRARWKADGFENGVLGYPTGAPLSIDGNLYQRYEGGAIGWSANSGPIASHGTIGARWVTLGGAESVLGAPAGEITCGTRDGGCYQDFVGGAISSTPAYGTWETFGPIRARWQATGFETGAIGYPTGAPVCGTKNGGCYQNFERGAVSWTAATGAWETHGAIREYWRSQDFERGPLGYPLSAPVSDASGSTSQRFEGGLVSEKSGVITLTPSP